MDERYKNLTAVILAGGYGTRLAEETHGIIPKPMVTVGGHPLLDHIISIYASQGIRHFIVAAGYLCDQIEEWADGNKNHEKWGVSVDVVDTGLDTQIGGRMKGLIDGGRFNLRHRVKKDYKKPFLMTYGDGLADINIVALIEHHKRMFEQHGVSATLSAVNPPNRFGVLRFADGMCTAFSEKGYDDGGWINGGFYVIEQEVTNLIPGDTCVWEKDVLPILASQGRLSVFQHPGTFQMMDTWRDRVMLEKEWEGRNPFWTKWSGKEYEMALW